MARHGGGAFSGKDPTKVDRSAAYAARWVAKNVVAAGLADRFEVEVAYGIGIARPISFSVDSFGTGRIDDAAIQALIERHFDLRPASIIAALDLRRPIYRQTAAYGHFGRPDLDLPVGAHRQGGDPRGRAGLPMPEPESRPRPSEAPRPACNARAPAPPPPRLAGMYAVMMAGGGGPGSTRSADRSARSPSCRCSSERTLLQAYVERLCGPDRRRHGRHGPPIRSTRP